MSRFLPVVVGADLLSAPATLPDQPVAEDLDGELADLLCRDEEWLDATFQEIIATSWGEPPRGGTPRQAARPRRPSLPVVRAPRHDGSRRSQWCPNPYRRQRSPPPLA